MPCHRARPLVWSGPGHGDRASIATRDRLGAIADMQCNTATRTLERTNRVSPMLRALTATLAVATGLCLASSSASADPAVVLPARVKPGTVVDVKTSGFPAASGVHIQWGVKFNAPANCCVTPFFPALSARGLPID